MKGLIIKPYWTDLILSGEKTVEVRGSKTSVRGEIGIIKSGSKSVYGTAFLYDCKELTREDFENTYKESHRINMSYDELLKIYPKPHAWFIKVLKVYGKPIPYEHKRGCVIWVNL